MVVRRFLLSLSKCFLLALFYIPAFVNAQNNNVRCSISVRPTKEPSSAQITIEFSQPVRGFSYNDLFSQNAVINDFVRVASEDRKYTSIFSFRLDGIFKNNSQSVSALVAVPRGAARSIKSARLNSRCGPFKIHLTKKSETPTPINTLEPQPSAIYTATRTAVVPTETPASTVTPRQTATSARTPQPTATKTSSPTVTLTKTATSTISVPSTATVTKTATATFTRTSTPTASITITPVLTSTSTVTPTVIVTFIPTFAPTQTPTFIPTRTSTETPTPPSGTATATPTSTPSGVAVDCSGALASLPNTLPIFPGAEGFGTKTTAGSGRHLATPCAKIYKVTNLKDSGQGSLRQCVEASGSRTCIFEVGGIIWSTKALKITNPFLTIAGQTAPSPGIIIRGAGISTEASNVFIQHIKVRPGDDERAACCKTSTCGSVEAQSCTQDPGSRDGINTYATGSPIDNVVYDHISISWALDEGWSVNPDKADISNITLSNSIIDSGLDMSIHPEASNPADPGHSKAVLIKGLKNVNNLSFHKNLLTHNAERNIRIGSSVSMEYINNIVYDWGRGKGVGRLIEATNSTSAKHTFDLIGNVYIPGPDTFCPETQYRPELCSAAPGGIDTPEQRAKMHYILRLGSGISGGLSALSRYYLLDNLGTTRVAGDEWNIVDRGFFTSNTSTTLIFPTQRANAPVATSGSVLPLSTEDAYAHVITHAGAKPQERDIVDQNAIGDLITLSGRIINCVADDGSARCQKNAGGWPSYPATTRALMLPENPFADSDRDGYTNLENWLQSF